MTMSDIYHPDPAHETSRPSAAAGDRPLRICLLSYRSNPHCGGQGVYLKQLSRGLKDLGHQVEVVSGPPDPQLDDDIPVHRIPSLDLYDPADPFRTPRLAELCDPAALYEWLSVSTMGFPEPFLFGLKACRHLMRQARRYDVVHDNQCLAYGIWSLSRRMPLLATIHHPITRDRQIALRAEPVFWRRLKELRWYSFIRMQKHVARRLPRILTVSECARQDISRDFDIPPERFEVVPNGINTELFYPMPEIRRDPHRIITTTSADTPLKGLAFLLRAVHIVRQKRPLQLVVVGQPKPKGAVLRLLGELGLEAHVRFTGRISQAAFVRHYAQASLAVVASLYEGFGLPAGEAMACAVPVVSTTGGALPEVVGDAGFLVPPGDHQALAAAIQTLLDDPQRAATLGAAGYRRVQKRFTWRRAAARTVAVYREVIRDYGRF
jgi:glycosyltransferase involved in cell wall biosynthesis